jgi:hypothetical protein
VLLFNFTFCVYFWSVKIWFFNMSNRLFGCISVVLRHCRYSRWPFCTTRTKTLTERVGLNKWGPIVAVVNGTSFSYPLNDFTFIIIKYCFTQHIKKEEQQQWPQREIIVNKASFSTTPMPMATGHRVGK